MKRAIIKVFIVVFAIVIVLFLYVFVRSLPLNLSLQGVDVNNLKGIDIFIMPEDFEDFGAEKPFFTAWVTDKTAMKECAELLQNYTYKYQTMGTPFGRGDVYLEVRFVTKNHSKGFNLQMYREIDSTRDFGIKTIYKGHEYYINRFSEVDEKKLYDTLYEVAKADPTWNESYIEEANPVQLEDTVLP